MQLSTAMLLFAIWGILLRLNHHNAQLRIHSTSFV